MKTKTIYFTLIAMLTLTTLIFQSCTTDNCTKENTASITPIEGVFQYLPPLQGQAIMIDNHFSYVVGLYDSTMVAQTGTYIEKNDTIYNEIIYSSNPELIGYKYKWSVESLNGDTLIYVIYNNEGEITRGGKSVRVN
ncbi:MAG: hypothetical protein HN593_03215 [Lentimicrobiaceae bacterium]|jgi:hypothetical protein|nr:hypothetical protein [Lentimicrobiaceae bacterium]MBT6963604.1 hypothetical protein [Lentimicrobiaceae bacterium]MBT7037111.1 hypothetical protein [Lentimicrobiaceae bacterium]MBT7621424.1 hypothetical protein [Lentimicrobiaceae bacterium]MCP4909167.1 hypothetical protein [Bacteroidota bacterium]